MKSISKIIHDNQMGLNCKVMMQNVCKWKLAMNEMKENAGSLNGFEFFSMML